MALQETDLTGAEREKELEELREKAREAELKAARSEAALEEQRRIRENAPAPAAQQPAQISEEAWQKMETESGQTRQQLQSTWAISSEAARLQSEPLKAELKAAREEAAKASRELENYRKGSNQERILEKFYKDNPAYAAYRKDVDDFIADYPEEVRNDPEKLAKITERAKVFVRGKVGEKVKPNSEGSFSSGRLGGGSSFDQVEGEDDEDAVNLNGVENEAERRGIITVAERFKANKPGKELYKKHAMADGSGVNIRAEDEFAAIHAQQEKKRQEQQGW